MTEKILECYRLLELEPDAPIDMVKNAYRDLIKVWHPDRFPDDLKFQEKATEKTRALNVAYQVICDHLSTRKNETLAKARLTPEEMTRAREIAVARFQQEMERRTRAEAEAKRRAQAEKPGPKPAVVTPAEPAAPPKAAPPVSAAPSKRPRILSDRAMLICGISCCALIALYLVFRTSHVSPTYARSAQFLQRPPSPEPPSAATLNSVKAEAPQATVTRKADRGELPIQPTWNATTQDDVETDETSYRQRHTLAEWMIALSNKPVTRVLELLGPPEYIQDNGRKWLYASKLDSPSNVGRSDSECLVLTYGDDFNVREARSGMGSLATTRAKESMGAVKSTNALASNRINLLARPPAKAPEDHPRKDLTLLASNAGAAPLSSWQLAEASAKVQEARKLAALDPGKQTPPTLGERFRNRMTGKNQGFDELRLKLMAKQPEYVIAELGLPKSTNSEAGEWHYVDKFRPNPYVRHSDLVVTFELDSNREPVKVSQVSLR